MSDRDKCYTCVYRRDVPGDAHSACVHPATAATWRSPVMQLAGVLGKRGGDQLVAAAEQHGEGPGGAMHALGIEFVEQGVRNGWAIWPVNFDPVWLVSCLGFLAPERNGGQGGHGGEQKQP